MFKTSQCVNVSMNAHASCPIHLFTELYFEAKPNFLNPLSFFPFAFSLTGLVKPHPENV